MSPICPVTWNKRFSSKFEFTMVLCTRQKWVSFTELLLLRNITQLVIEQLTFSLEIPDPNTRIKIKLTE